MLKIIRYIAGITCAISIIFIYLVYIGQNRFSLMLNQGSSVPDGLKHISISMRRGLPGVLFNAETHASASCETSVQNLRRWLKHSEFEVIHYLPDTSDHRQFFTTYASLPETIINSGINYYIQLKRISGDTRIMHVKPVDEENVLISYDMDWN